MFSPLPLDLECCMLLQVLLAGNKMEIYVIISDLPKLSCHASEGFRSVEEV